MNVFVIHSTKDEEEVEKHILNLKRKAYNINTLLLKNGNCFWKLSANSKIKKAQIVLFFLGKESHLSPYIGWELSQAIKHKKPIYTIKLDENNICHEATTVEDEYSGAEKQYDQIINPCDLIDVINNYEKGIYDIFNQNVDEIDKNVLLEQYKAFLQTSEDLVSRRQSVNSFYISISSALIALFSALFAFEIPMVYRVLIGIMFSMVGAVLSWSWIKMLAAYGNLNGSKMKIISSIEKQLPASLFDAEWEALSDKLNKKRYVSFTDGEKVIPKIFMIIYLFIFIVLVLAMIINFLPFFK